MAKINYDIIVIGCGSGGLSVGLFMNQAGFKVLMVSRSDKDIGGECLNDGCIPSKALIHVSKIAHYAKQSEKFGLSVSGNVDLKKAIDYIFKKQQIIRAHENAKWLGEQGIDIALGEAKFTGRNEIEVEKKNYAARKIVIATGSKARKLNIPGVEKVTYYDNENIFHATQLPESLLVIGGGPIGIEIAQAMSRLGSKVTIIDTASGILEHDDEIVKDILLQQLKKEGINFIFKATTEKFTSSGNVEIKLASGGKKILHFDAVFVAIGRELNVETLQLANANIKVAKGKIIVNKYLQTTNKNIFVCGDIAGDLQFSHAAEFHARILINNFLSPFNKKLNNDHLSWVTFTDPELATFGLSEKQLKDRNIPYERLEEDFIDDDRAVVDDYTYAKMVLFIKKKFLSRQKILGGTMIAPNAGELIQELVLANTKGLSINSIFDKIYAYPVAARISQKAIISYKQKALTGSVKKLLRIAFKLFG